MKNFVDLIRKHIPSKKQLLAGVFSAPLLIFSFANSFAQTANGNLVRVLQKMSSDIGSENEVSIKTMSIFDDPFEGKYIKKMVYHHIYLERPNRMQSKAVFDDGSQWFSTFDGQRVQVLNPGAREYSAVDFSGNLNELADFLDENGLSNTPLIDFIRDNYAEAIDSDSGSVTLIDGYIDPAGSEGKTHHFVFEDYRTDWQLWVSEGAKSLPKQLVLEYSELGRPEYLVQFNDWKFGGDAESVDVPNDLTGWTKTDFENPIRF